MVASASFLIRALRKLLLYGGIFLILLMLTCLFLCKGVPQLQLSHAHMRDGINILDMLNILAAAMLPPSPSPAIFHDLFFSGKTVCIQWKSWVSVSFSVM